MKTSLRGMIGWLRNERLNTKDGGLVKERVGCGDFKPRKAVFPKTVLASMFGVSG
jgi:hypothetical protein